MSIQQKTTSHSQNGCRQTVLNSGEELASHCHPSATLGTPNRVFEMGHQHILYRSTENSEELTSLHNLRQHYPTQ